MKIVQIVHGFPPELASGGTERYTQALAAGLTERGHEVIVLAGTLELRGQIVIEEDPSAGYRVLRLHRDDIYFERWDKGHHPGVSRAVADLLEAERPDLVHVQHWLRLTRDLVRQAHGLDIPTVLTLHDFHATCPTVFRLLPDQSFCTSPPGPKPCPTCLGEEAWWGENERARGIELFRSDFENELQLANRVLVLSNAQGRLLSRLTGIDDSRFLRQPFRALARLRPLPPPASPPPLRVVTWGHQGPHKGQDLLLEAIGRMRHPDRVELDIFGACVDPDYDEKLEALSGDLAVTRHGAFEHEDLQALTAHVAVFPSRAQESYGFVLDEARMLGLPTLVSDVGAYAERVGPGGETFPCNDAPALAAHLDRMLEEPDRLQRLRAAIQPPGPFTENVAFLERLYREVAQEGPSRAPDRFDQDGHLEHEFRRFEARERIALRLRSQIEGMEPG